MTTNSKPIPRQHAPNVNDRDPAARTLGPIPAAAAEAEPPAERLYKGMPEAELPADLGTTNHTEAPVEPAKKPMITLSTTVQHRGRTITITAIGMKVDTFCDYLDLAKYDTPAPQQWQTLPDGTPLCPKHATPMKKREKQGDEWWSHRVFNADGEELWCKGYHGKDSPGYEY